MSSRKCGANLSARPTLRVTVEKIGNPDITHEAVGTFATDQTNPRSRIVPRASKTPVTNHPVAHVIPLSAPAVYVDAAVEFAVVVVLAGRDVGYGVNGAFVVESEADGDEVAGTLNVVVKMVVVGLGLTTVDDCVPLGNENWVELLAYGVVEGITSELDALDVVELLAQGVVEAISSELDSLNLVELLVGIVVEAPSTELDALDMVELLAQGVLEETKTELDALSVEGVVP
ncbi:hypothetical protein BU23DRAFT_635673 [Bimuria novae-zelandiae CBS 107.79]|uniref:Uncharacterized protein n=1 Tax=Bimuria novae-zelandiae CBS 107.79 TaxID=1447943 RepID=A0A6A5VCF2_9PLEO|nr:hypothetical protein BU23DRAFT_635673 [Bimuria novae-zelandiae CBS 107.79]